MGEGCRLCGRKRAAEHQRLKKEDFIERARLKHGDIYSYDLVEYVNNYTKIKLICSIHGVFEQYPGNHLKGHGCKKCSDKANSLGQRKPLSDFISEANSVHNDKYDYCLVNYVNYVTNVVIVCPKHGKFEQLPCVHLRGGGCPKCTSSMGERRILEFLRGFSFVTKHQKRFAKCRSDKAMLPFDFYFRIGKYNFLVEYDGELHFRPSRRRNGLEKFLRLQQTDVIKTKFAQDNGFILIRVSYTEKNPEWFLQCEIEKYIDQSLNDFRTEQIDNRDQIEIKPMIGWQLSLGLSSV